MLRLVTMAAAVWTRIPSRDRRHLSLPSMVGGVAVVAPIGLSGWITSPDVSALGFLRTAALATVFLAMEALSIFAAREMLTRSVDRIRFILKGQSFRSRIVLPSRSMSRSRRSRLRA